MKQHAPTAGRARRMPLAGVDAVTVAPLTAVFTSRRPRDGPDPRLQGRRPGTTRLPGSRSSWPSARSVCQ
jgi:hypothetical protein